jgi:hypothetical protein
MTTAKEAIQLWDRLETERQVYKVHCQDVANHLYPDRNDIIVERVPGQKRMTYIYDTTPMFANDMFAGGMHSLLTSTSLQWAYLWADDNRLNQDDDVRFWLQDAADVMFRLFSSARHNFASQSHELYLDEGAFGMACMGILDSPRTGTHFTTRHLKEYNVIVNDEDRVDGLVRKWKWTARQAFDKWGEAAGPKVAKAIADGKEFDKFEFIHLTRPRVKRDPQRAERKHKAWESLYVAVADEIEIDEGGFDEFPYVVPRFAKLTGEDTGRGPGMTNLPDIKMLMEMVKVLMKAAQKIIDPPLLLPDDGFLVPIKTVPGAQNFYRATGNGELKALETKGNIPIGIELVNAMRQQILRGFYVEWMLMPSDPSDPAAAGKGVTATYVLQQRDEKMRLLSPMLARLQAEFLGPLIDRVFAMLWRRSLTMRFAPGSPFRMPPAKLQGVPLRVEYVSPIALAQKSAQMDAVTRLLQLQAQLRQMDPQGQLIIDSEMMMRLAGRDWNAPAGVLKGAAALVAEREQTARAAQAQAGTDQAANLAGALKDGAAGVRHLASIGGGSPQGQRMAA